LKEVIIEDSLAICEELDRRMDHLVESYHDEWAEVVNDPEKRKKFKQFVNTDEIQERDEMIEFIDMRGQLRPADWPADGEPQTNWQAPKDDIFSKSEKKWIKVGKTSDFSKDSAGAILYGETQLAVFRNEKRGEWYCTQNMCPHKQAFVLSQGIVGDSNGTPKVACPLHKKNFDLKTGAELDGDLQIITFQVKIENDDVLVELPAVEEVDAILGTAGMRVQKSDCIDLAEDAIKVKPNRQSSTVLMAKPEKRQGGSSM